MIQSEKNIPLKGYPKEISQEDRHNALMELAQLMAQAQHEWITQMQYDLATEKKHTLQFFIRHWGSWAKAVQEAQSLLPLQRNFAPKPSPLAGYVQCICGKAQHCQGRFLSQNKRKIRMCDPCRAWSEGVNVDENLLYFTYDYSNAKNSSKKSLRGRPGKSVKA